MAGEWGVQPAALSLSAGPGPSTSEASASEDVLLHLLSSASFPCFAISALTSRSWRLVAAWAFSDSSSLTSFFRTCSQE